MKNFLSVSVFLIAAAAARGDLVVEQKAEAARGASSSETVKIQGQRVRFDFSGPEGPVTMLVDLKQGRMTTLDHKGKSVTRTTAEELSKLTEGMRRASARAPLKAEGPKATGQKEKVGDWNCEIYEVKVDGLVSR